MKTLIGIIVSAQYGPVCVATFAARKGLLKREMEACFECMPTMQYPEGTFADVIGSALRGRTFSIPEFSQEGVSTYRFEGFSKFKGRSVEMDAIPEFTFFSPHRYCYVDVKVSDANSIIFVDPQDHGMSIEKTLTANLHAVVNPATFTSCDEAIADMKRRIAEMTLHMKEFAAQCKEKGVETGIFTIGETTHEKFAIQGAGQTKCLNFSDLENLLIGEVVQNLSKINDQQAGQES